MVVEGIKEFYYSLEEKWYGFWDKIDSKVPVYGVIDAVDSVVPSFLLFLLLVFLLVVFIAFLMVGSNNVYDVTFTIVDSTNKPIKDTVIFAKLMDNGVKLKDLNQRTDGFGQVTFRDIKQGQELKFDINISKGTFDETFTVTGNLEEKIKLKEKEVIPEPVTKKILVKTVTNQNVTENVSLEFACENSSTLPNPASATWTNSGAISVVEPVGCKLTATPHNSKYKQTTTKIDSTQYTLLLEPYEEPTTSIKVKIRADGYVVNDTSFTVKLKGLKEYSASTGSASEATIQVVPGSYLLTVSDPKNNYGIVSQSVDVNTAAEVIMAVTKSVKGKITIKVVDKSNNSLISDATVSAKDNYGREIATSKTDATGTVQFSFTDVVEYSFSAKKVGTEGMGYFANETPKIKIEGDINTTVQLEKITTANAGRVKVKVLDQDGIAVINAKIMLKYVENDGIVELNQENNYLYTDINGEATFLAGKVEGLVYAYAIKGPFTGSSLQKTIAIDQLNLFNIEVEVGEAKIIINVTDEAARSVNGTAEILTLDGLAIDEHGVAGLISIEGGKATRQVKAGQSVYVKVQGDSADSYEDYYTVPVSLWPNQTYTFNITMLKQISAPSITKPLVYNENNNIVQTLAAGKKYYAKFNVNSDDEYNNVIIHFRVGTQTMMTNDYMEIDTVEAANVTETRGVTYDPVKGYDYDSENTTDGLAKWTNIKWDNFGKATREVKVWFRIKKTAPPNQELRFYYRGQFDDIRVPESTADEDFYADCKESDPYYVGTEAECTEGFCASSEWLYSQKEQLYIDPPFDLKQVVDYTYHVSILNNTGLDYGSDTKPIYMNIIVVGDSTAANEKRIQLTSYSVEDTVGTYASTNTTYGAEGIELESFEQNTKVDTTLTMQGKKDGAEAIKFQFRSEGRIIYEKEVSFNVVKEKDFSLTISPSFIPALINTPITVQIFDPENNYLPGATVTTYAKEPGFEKYLMDSDTSDRMGKATVDSGALFDGSDVILEITMEGYSSQSYSITVSSVPVTYSPSTINVSLNTYSYRDETVEMSFANASQRDLVIKDIEIDASLSEVINEGALIGFVEELSSEERTIPAEDVLTLDLLKISLANGITQDNFLEPISMDGTIIITFEEPLLYLTYEVEVPITIDVSSDASPGSDCLVISANSATTAVTEGGQVRYDIELQNGCESDDVGIPLDAIYVTSPADIYGTADITIKTTNGSRVMQTALDGTQRLAFNDVAAGEKLYGTIIYAPSTEAVGQSVTLQIGFTAKFQEETIDSSPSTLTFTADVINLKDCMTITGDTSAVGFDESAKVTIETTKCLGQDIDVMLCKNDSGCSGGTDGKVTLSSKSFTLNNESKEVEVYSPTYPGSYGVTVHARTRGTAGFSYIGEVAVAFREPEAKFFNLNKYELNLVGTGSVDSMILTNKMVSQTVNVKANECIWGEEDGEFSWSKALSGAMIGASIGSMIGNMFGTETTEGEVKDEDGEGFDAAKQAESSQFATDSTTSLNGETEMGYTGMNGAEMEVEQGGYIGESIDDSSINGIPSAAKTVVNNDGVLSTTYSYVTDPATGNTLYVNASNGTLINADGSAYMGSYQIHTTGASTVSLSSGSASYTITKTQPYSGGTTSGNPYYTAHNNATLVNINATSTTGLANNVVLYDSQTSLLTENAAWAYTTAWATGRTYGTSTSSKNAWKPSASQAPDPNEKLNKLFFGSTTTTSTNWKGIITTVAAAVIAGYLMGNANLYKCAENYAVVGYDDFVILLQGTDVSVTNPEGDANAEQTVESDAGDLTFTLGEISPSWNFEDAFYTTDEETVAIDFENTGGLNEAQASYGTLTVTATEHNHGNQALSVVTEESDASTGENDYDVFCKTANFGEYWIGSDANEGLCTGVSSTTYSQKYHIRVISGEAQDEEAYIHKANSCYMGSLTGSTGATAVPKVSLDWEWDDVAEDYCDYTNPDYVYCDATQFTIALVKKMAHIDAFEKANANSFACPPDTIDEAVENSVDEINDTDNDVGAGVIGVDDIVVSVDTEADTASAVVTIVNNSGANQYSYVTYAWKGEGESTDDQIQYTIPSGTSTLNIPTYSVPEANVVYTLTIVVNGEKGDRLPLTRAFLNKAEDANCWVANTTSAVSGIPGIVYYVQAMSDPSYSSQHIEDLTDLESHINFGAYLMKDAFTDDFLNDFVAYYKNKIATKASVTTEQREILDYIDSGNFKIIKKFQGTTDFVAGLYDVWINIDSEDGFRVVDGNTTEIEVTLLLVKTPSVDSPLYNMPFDGEVGMSTGDRQGYGNVYANDGNMLTISSQGGNVYTKYNATGNGVTSVSTSSGSDFDMLNAQVATRGQVASIYSSGDDASITLSPNYATPVILMYNLAGTSGDMAFSIQNSSGAVTTSGNVSYWTGAARSKDYYGANAVETYDDSPDYLIDEIADNAFGFSFDETSRSGIMYLKSVLYAPADGTSYLINAEEANTSIWTPNEDFTSTAELRGIDGMEYNSGSDYINSLEDLFAAVEAGVVCVSNDGSSSTYWWNPAVIETTVGGIDSQYNKELSLVGTS